jgi:hypothetical protein
MAWIEAKSSMIKSYQYTPEGEVDGVPFGRLEIKWSNGASGAYLDVNRRTYEEFAEAKSLGKFLNSVIKPSFRYVRTQEPPDDTGEGQEQGSEETGVSVRPED